MSVWDCLSTYGREGWRRKRFWPDSDQSIRLKGLSFLKAMGHGFSMLKNINITL